MFLIIRKLLFAGLLLIPSLAFATQSICSEIRAGIDIGSGTTKMVVARVNRCTQMLEAILAPQPGSILEVPVEYKKNVVEMADGRRVFRLETEVAGLAALTEFKAIAISYGAQKFSAVATSAFRSLSESYRDGLTTRIFEQLGIRVRVIEQSEEARLGFHATVVKLGVPRTDVLVWDIGGGSMQIAYWDDDKHRVSSYEGQFANNAMQTFVIEQLQKVQEHPDTSPNPMLTPTNKGDHDNHVFAAIHKAEQIALTTTSEEQRARFRATSHVIGIGGVHYYSNCGVTKQSSGCEITWESLQQDILDHGHLTDAKLIAAGRADSIKYAPKRITAGALTVGFMKALGFERVRSEKISMADGILITPGYW